MPSKALGKSSLANARVANEQGIVLVAPAQDLDGPFDFGLATDQWVDPTISSFPVQVYAVAFQSFMPFTNNLLATSVVVVALHRPTTLLAGYLADAVGDVIHGIQTSHILHLQEIDRMRFSFREKRHEHIGAGNLLTAGRLHVNHRTLDDPLKTGCRLGVDR